MDTNKIYIRTFFGDKIMLSISKDKKEAYVKSIVHIPIDWRSMPHVLEYKIPIYPDETLGSILARVHKVISDHREEWKCEAHGNDTICLDCGNVLSEYWKMKAGLF